MFLRVERHPPGPRLFVGPVRVHHWHWGALFVGWGFRLIWRDRRDLPGFNPEVGVTTSDDGGVW